MQITKYPLRCTVFNPIKCHLADFQIHLSFILDMSLCHFKICNMGRKRNLHWIPWIRRWACQWFQQIHL